MDSCTIAEHKLGRVSTFENASFPAASCYSCVFECRSSSFWTGFAHQQVAVCQRYPPLQTDGGKVGLLKLLRQHWTGVCEINVFYQLYVWGWLQWCYYRYYADIRQTISASDQEMNSALAELSRVSAATAQNTHTHTHSVAVHFNALCFRTIRENWTTWWHCTSSTSTSINTTTRCVSTFSSH